jgi:hypothetical protein
MPAIPTLGMLTQKDCEFEISLGYIMSSRKAWAILGFCISKKKKKNSGFSGSHL